MATISSKLEIELTVNLTLSEIEARALQAMTVYGVDSFLKGYYKQLGKHHIKPYEEGFRILFPSINKQLSSHFDKVDKARALCNEK